MSSRPRQADADWVEIRPRSLSVVRELRELWEYRELIGFLALRDVKVRYKQAILGASWAVIQPVVTMLVFSVFFGLLLGAEDKPTAAGVPYAISTFCALVPWQLFATSLIFSGNSLVANQHIITRVYFPRLIAPIAPVLATLLDFVLSFLVLIGLIMGFHFLTPYSFVPRWSLVALPFLVMLSVLAALSVSIWLSAINAIYRDVRHAIPFIVQIWMFATPVVYSSEFVVPSLPGWAQVLYGLNPMTAVVEGFRWALLGTPAPALATILMSLLGVAALLSIGVRFFFRMERVFVDVI